MLRVFFHETEMEITPQEQKECPIPQIRQGKIFTDMLKGLLFPLFTKGYVCINVKKKITQTESYTLSSKKQPVT